MNTNSPSVMQFPSSDTILKSDFIRAKPAFAKSTGQSQRSSAAMTLQDPVATHLLVETALGDSKGFDVLSYEELDTLKKEEAMLVARLDGLRHKLALESKVRDAARSMNRLYNNANGSPHGRRPSVSGQISPVTAERAGKELEESEKKCEELGREYYYLEQRLKQVQFNLLKHTAGVLQATYGNGHRPRVDLYGLPGGRPYSPDSGEDFSKRNNPNATTNVANNPATERNWDKVFEYDDYGNDGDLEGYIDELKTPSKGPGGANAAKQREAQMAIGKRLEELNAFVRAILGQVNPKSPIAQAPSPKLPQDTKSVDASIFDQLNSLSRGLDEIKEEQRSLKLERQLKSRPQTPKTPKMDTRQQQQQELAQEREMQETEDRMTLMLAELNAKFVDIISTSAPQEVTPPIPGPNLGSAAQVKYAQDRLVGITKVLRSLSLTAQRAQNGGANASQYDAVLQGLWQFIRSGEKDALERKREERQRISQRRMAGEDVDESEAELSPDDEENQETEEFSLSAFSTKVQWLVAKSSYLREKQSDLQRRMRHLRRDLEDREKARREEVDSLSQQIERLDIEKETAKEELQRVQMQLNEGQNLNQAQINELTQSRKAMEDLRTQIRQKENQSGSLRSQLEDATRKHSEVKDRLLVAEQSVRKWEADHGVAVRAKDASEKQVRDVTQKHERTQRDLMDMESQLARITTELTIARADMDAAQGMSKNERAIAEKSARDEAEARLGRLVTAAEDRERSLKNDLDSLRKELMTVKSNLDAVQGRNKTDRAAADERERSLKKDLESVRTMHRDTQSQLQRAEVQARAIKVDPAAKQREDELRRELEATLRDFEDLTRASVEAEKEREELEKVADSLRDKVEELEVQVNDERIAKLGAVTSTGSGTTAGSGSVRNSDGSERGTTMNGSTSAVVLKNEFKKMMREARAEHQRALKHEQEERRKVESQLRSLRRDQATTSLASGRGKIGVPVGLRN